MGFPRWMPLCLEFEFWLLISSENVVLIGKWEPTLYNSAE